MIEHASIFHAEDNPDWATSFSGLLEDFSPHKVTARANDLHSALIQVPQFKAKNIHLAILDQNLDSSEPDVDHGLVVATAIRETHGENFPVFSLSSASKENPPAWSKFHIPKIEISERFPELIDRINKL